MRVDRLLITLTALVVVVVSFSAHPAQLFFGTGNYVYVAGAACDGVTDDTAAFQAAINTVRANQPPSPSNGLPSAVIVFPQTGTRNCLIKSTIDMTMLRSFAYAVEGMGTTLICQTNGTPCIDMLGSRHVYFDDLTLTGDTTRTPSYGIQIGRISTDTADLMHFTHLTMIGAYTKAAFYNFASEDFECDHCYLLNGYTGAGAYALIEDGINHFGIQSAFVTQTSPQDTPRSFNETLWNVGNFLVTGNAGSIPIFEAGGARHKFVASYIGNVTNGAYEVELYNIASARNYMLSVDAHTEQGNVTDVFLVDGTVTAPVLDGLSFTDHDSFASNSLFKLGGSATSATLNNANIQVERFESGSGVKLFDSPSVWTVQGGYIYLPAAGNYTAPGAISGLTCTPACTLH